MTTLTNEEIKQQFLPKPKEVKEWLKKHKGFGYDFSKPDSRKSKRAFRRARRRLKAAAIRRTPGKDISHTGTITPWQVIYGTARVGAQMSYIAVNNNNLWLHLILTFAGHETESSGVQNTRLFLDNEEVIFGASPDNRWSTQIQRLDGSYAAAPHKVFLATNSGTMDQPAMPDLVNQIPNEWTENCRQAGFAHNYVILEHDPTLFPNGLPSAITLEERGMKCYDPRSSLTVWTENAALIIANFLMDSRIGLGISSSKLDMSSLSDAATCAEILVSSEKQYTINGSFEVDDTPQGILDDMCAAMGGYLTYVGGKIKFWPAKWRVPTFTLNESDLLSTITVTTMDGEGDYFNGVRGTYDSPQARWEEIDFPAVKNDTYMAGDGGVRIWEDVQFPFTIYPNASQRLGKLLLEQRHQGIEIDYTATLKSFELEVGDNYYVNYAPCGWVNKTFVVEELELVQENTETGPLFAVHIHARETAEGVFSWNNGEETTVDVAPNSSLPSPFNVQDVTGLTLTSGTSELYPRSDGTIFSRIKVAWTALTDAYVLGGGRVEIQYKRHSVSDWSVAPAVPGDQTFAHVLDVQDGAAYDVRVRAVNSLSIPGNWATQSNYTVVGKTEPPSDVATFTAAKVENGIKLNWSDISDVDRASFEIRDGNNWATGSVIFSGDATSFLWQFQPWGTHVLWIKAIDTSGNYSANAKSATVVVTAPGPVSQLRGWAVDTNIVLDWQEPLLIDQPIAGYRVYREGLHQLIAWPDGTFFTRPEVTGGYYTYSVTAVDAAGNESEQTNVQVLVYPPNDYRLEYDEIVEWGAEGAENFAITESNALCGPFDVTKTFADQFSGYSTWAEKIAAGLPRWAQPTGETTAHAEFLYWTGGATVQQAIISVGLDASIVGGASLTVSILTSLDGDTWTTYQNTSEVMGHNFQYVLVTVDVESDGVHGFVYIPPARLRIMLKTAPDSGEASITDTVGDGTEVFFNKLYLDAETPHAQVLGTTQVTAVVNFVDVPNPRSFKVLLFDKNGNRVTGTIHWDVVGIVSEVN